MKSINESAILKCAGDQCSVDYLHKIFAWRKQVMEFNRFQEDDSRFSLNLCGLDLSFKVSNAFSAIETFQEIFVENSHCKHQDFFPEKASCVLDIGANQGFYSLKMKTSNPHSRVIAYEPNPYEFASLRLNFSANAVADDIVAVNCAVSGHAGMLKMEVIPQIGPIGGVALRATSRKWLKDDFIKEIEVEAVTLDAVLARHDVGKVDILKMDVEGSEIDILRNFCGIDAVDKAVIEYHSATGREDLLEIMTENGFEMVYEDFNPGDYFGDAYFVRK